MRIAIKDRIKPITGLLSERNLFLLILTLNLIPILISGYVPTMDGAAHLYNANMLKEMLVGNEFLNQYFSVNPEIIPNWSGHFILGALQVVLEGVWSEKVLLLSMMIGLPLSFRFLLSQIHPTGKIWSITIFPFTYSFVFALGFYNFCFAFIPFFLAIGYWHKWK